MNQALAVSYADNTNAGTATASAAFAGGPNHLASSDTKNFTINKAVLTVTADAQEKQYSDPVPALTFTPSGFVNGETASVILAQPTCTTTATTTSGPGTYPITCSGASANNYTFTYVPGTLTVTKEDALADYTGLDMVFTASASANTVTIALRATIRDIDDVANGGLRGDIRKATVTFVNRDSNAVLCGPVNVGLIFPDEPTLGTATCNWMPNIGSADSQTFTVGIVVNGWYTRDHGGDNTVVTVSKPMSNFITGGGHLVMTPDSRGSLDPKPGAKMNFGFNVKPNKKGTNLQGNMNIIVRANDGKVYQIKANAMDTLTVNANTGKATFTSKANLTDVTDSANPIAMGGNLALTVKLTDKGEPGSADSISVELFHSNGTLIFSSNWNGTTTLEQLLNGGNLSVK